MSGNLYQRNSCFQSLTTVLITQIGCRRNFADWFEDVWLEVDDLDVSTLPRSSPANLKSLSTSPTECLTGNEDDAEENISYPINGRTTIKSGKAPYKPL